MIEKLRELELSIKTEVLYLRQPSSKAGGITTRRLELTQSNKGAAPRVTLDDIEANIVSTEIVKHVAPSGQVLRWAVLTTRSGFAVTGRPSASVCAENDNATKGEEVAIENAKHELWPLMGYALKERLYHEQRTAQSKPAHSHCASHLVGRDGPQLSVPLA